MPISVSDILDLLMYLIINYVCVCYIEVSLYSWPQKFVRHGIYEKVGIPTIPGHTASTSKFQSIVAFATYRVIC